MNAAVVCDLLRSGFCGLGPGAGGASWVRGSSVALLALFTCEVCPIVLCDVIKLSDTQCF